MELFLKLEPHVDFQSIRRVSFQTTCQLQPWEIFIYNKYNYTTNSFSLEKTISADPVSNGNRRLPTPKCRCSLLFCEVAHNKDVRIPLIYVCMNTEIVWTEYLPIGQIKHVLNYIIYFLYTPFYIIISMSRWLYNNDEYINFIT